MLQTTAIGFRWRQGREEGGEDVKWVWLCEGCVATPIQEMKLAVAWAVLYSGIDECVCSVACGIGCLLLVSRH